MGAWVPAQGKSVGYLLRFKTTTNDVVFGICIMLYPLLLLPETIDSFRKCRWMGIIIAELVREPDMNATSPTFGLRSMKDYRLRGSLYGVV